MPSKKMAMEWLKSEVEHGRGEEKCHVVDVTADQEKRIKNEQRKTRFVLPTDDPDLCARLDFHKDRIFKKVRNKAIMLSLMERAWAEALCDQNLDRIMAELEPPV
jgi:hypothetical protein